MGTSGPKVNLRNPRKWEFCWEVNYNYGTHAYHGKSAKSSILRVSGALVQQQHYSISIEAYTVIYGTPYYICAKSSTHAKNVLK